MTAHPAPLRWAAASARDLGWLARGAYDATHAHLSALDDPRVKDFGPACDRAAMDAILRALGRSLSGPAYDGALERANAAARRYDTGSPGLPPNRSWTAFAGAVMAALGLR